MIAQDPADGDDRHRQGNTAGGNHPYDQVGGFLFGAFLSVFCHDNAPLRGINYKMPHHNRCGIIRDNNGKTNQSLLSEMQLHRTLLHKYTMDNRENQWYCVRNLIILEVQNQELQSEPRLLIQFT
jgi:hypothetical protein